jgi:LysM repeat protein
MEKRTSAFARIFAVLALAAAIAAVFVVVSGGVDDNSGKTSRNHPHKQAKTEEKKKSRTKAATYEIQPGDTLTRISAKTGVPVTELKALNPEVDALTLIAGETLKLR